jgi:Tol biopolymer transport system component
MRFPHARISVVIALAVAPSVHAQTTALVSVSSTGVQGNGGSGVDGISISSDGRFVAFASDASNFVAGYSFGASIYVHDAQSAVITRVSVDSAGVQGNTSSVRPSISSDGRYVAFDSFASNLVIGDTNSSADVFVHDAATGATTRASVDSSGAQANSGSAWASISPDGRFVTFISSATNLVLSDTNNFSDAFVHDRLSGTTELVSINSLGVQSNGASRYPSISGDGRFVAFASDANNLVPGDTNGWLDVFVHDRVSGATTRVSVDSAGSQGDFDSDLPSISGDGHFVVFQSRSSNLALVDANPFADIFVHDMQSGATSCVSVDSSGTQANRYCNSPKTTFDGRFVAFASEATNLVSGVTNGIQQIYVHDRQTGATTLASLDSSGVQGNGYCRWPSISSDGQYVAFNSDASNLVSGDTNLHSDVFARDRGPYPVTYGTAGTSTNGCVASISASGTPSASSSTAFAISVNSIEGLKPTILLYGLDNSGFTPSSWGVGTSYLCVKPPLQRTDSQNSGGAFNHCNGTLSLDWNAYIAAHPTALGIPFAAGQHVYAQAWYRDPPAPKTTNLSDALEFVVQP